MGVIAARGERSDISAAFVAVAGPGDPATEPRRSILAAVTNTGAATMNPRKLRRPIRPCAPGPAAGPSVGPVSTLDSVPLYLMVTSPDAHELDVEVFGGGGHFG